MTSSSINPFLAADNSARASQPSRISRSMPGCHWHPINASPGPAPHQPLPFPPCRRVRRPQLSRQLRRQPHQGPADLLPARPGLRPDGRQRHLPRRLRGTRHPCMSWDIHQGFDACDPNDFPPGECFDFIWAHPPYWRQKLYADDPRDLSRSPTLEHFLQRYRQFIRNCARALNPAASWPSSWATTPTARPALCP